jgi:hypothetical protein
MMSDTKRLTTAQKLYNELVVFESKLETVTRRLQEDLVDALRAGDVPENHAVDDCQRFLRELRQLVDSAAALGPAISQPVRLQQLRSALEQIVNDERWLANRSRLQQEVSYVLRIGHRDNLAPPFLVQLQTGAQKCLQEIDERTSATSDEIHSLQTTTQIYRDVAAILNDATNLDDAATEAALSRLNEAFGVGLIAAIYRNRLFVKSPAQTETAAAETQTAGPPGAGAEPGLGLKVQSSGNNHGSEAITPASSAGNTAGTTGTRSDLPQPGGAGHLQTTSAGKTSYTEPLRISCPHCSDKDITTSKIRLPERPVWLLGWRAFRCHSCNSRFWKWCPS